MSLNKNQTLLLGVAAGLLVGAALATAIPHLRESHPPEAAPHDAGPAHKIAFYRSSMNLNETSPTPGKDSMGMDYVPVYEDESAAASEVTGLAEVKIDSQRQQLIGLRTAVVGKGLVSNDWRTVGRVAVDETRVRKINVKVDGFVEQLFVDYLGEVVHRGDPLFTLYSPELLSAEQEYQLAIRTRAQLDGGEAGEELVASARRRLELWDISTTELDALERSPAPIHALTLHSPISGVVTAKNIVQGARLRAGETPYEITDFSTVWVLADAHESDLPRVRLGTPVTLTLEAVPDRAFRGAVSFIEPVLDARTRTATVRLVFANPRGELRPEMFGEIVFHSKPHEGLRVPVDTVIDSGDRKVVFVALAAGRFEPREVKTGATAGDLIEITDGLVAGERVVVRASFLIDSESQLQAALAALVAKPRASEAPAAVPIHQAPAARRARGGAKP